MRGKQLIRAIRLKLLFLPQRSQGLGGGHSHCISWLMGVGIAHPMKINPLYWIGDCEVEHAAGWPIVKHGKVVAMMN